MDYLMGTLRSHDQEHQECTEHFLCWQHSKETGLDILNVFMMYQVGYCQVHFPFPYNVFTMSWAGDMPPFSGVLVGDIPYIPFPRDASRRFATFRDISILS